MEMFVDEADVYFYIFETFLDSGQWYAMDTVMQFCVGPHVRTFSIIAPAYVLLRS